MAKNPDRPKKSTGKPTKSKPGRPDVQPIRPALAELLNPAINRGESGVGSSTGLQPPPDNSWDRRAGGEAAAHRARKSTPKNFEGDAGPRSTPLRSNPQPIGARSSSPPPRGVRREQSSLPRSGVGGATSSVPVDPSPRPSPTRGEGAEGAGFSEAGQSEFGP